MLFKAVSILTGSPSDYDVTGFANTIKASGLTHTRVLYSSLPAQAGTPDLQDLASAYASLSSIIVCLLSRSRFKSSRVNAVGNS